MRYAPTEWGKAFLWRRVLAHLWWLEADVTASTLFGDRLRVDARDTVGRYLFYFGVWEPNLTAWLRRSLRPGDAFVDIGANIGYFAVVASRLVGPAGKVVAIEALPAIHDVLSLNLSENQIGNVRAPCVAAWDTVATIEMYGRPGGVAGTSTAYASWADRWDLAPAQTVTALPLTDILSPEEINKVRVIKIDAEGAEWRVLKGLFAMLPRTRSDLEIMMEIAPDLLREEGVTPEAVFELLAEFGFRPFRIENSYEASEYYARPPCITPPRQLGALPQGLEQFDVIFSRKDSPTL
jgi:FkbM family methyltransferase